MPTLCGKAVLRSLVTSTGEGFTERHNELVFGSDLRLQLSCLLHLHHSGILRSGEMIAITCLALQSASSRTCVTVKVCDSGSCKDCTGEQYFTSPNLVWL